jgi:phytanoyl-CoA hydroxylase
MIKRLKLSYMVYNFFQRKKLFHNVPLYKKIGLKKFYFSSVSSKDFKNIDASLLKNKNALPAEQTTLFKELSAKSQENIQAFNETGYVLLEKYFSSELVDKINHEIDTLIANKTVSYRYINKIMFAFHHSELIRSVGENIKLLELLSALLEGDATLFQSINFLMGSQQKTHSDSIHMTTFPLGGLLGVWIALEDIDEESGPLHYYPGSHKFPYYLNSDYNNEGTKFLLGDQDYTEYENMLAGKIEALKPEKKVFTAKKGDLFIWHANLMHGGEPHLNKDKTRKSMVFHYYDRNCICYHEITQRPALMINN